MAQRCTAARTFNTLHVSMLPFETHDGLEIMQPTLTAPDCLCHQRSIAFGIGPPNMMHVAPWRTQVCNECHAARDGKLQATISHCKPGCTHACSVTMLGLMCAVRKRIVCRPGGSGYSYDLPNVYLTACRGPNPVLTCTRAYVNC